MALPEALLRLRNRLLSNPDFIAFAQRFPLTRPIARARSKSTFDLLAGFCYSQILHACVSLEIFERVGLKGATIDELAQSMGLAGDRCKLLVRAAAAIGLLDVRGDKVHLGHHGAALLGQPWIMRFVEHHRHFYKDLEDPVALLNGTAAPGNLRDYWNYADPAADKTAYSKLMAASQEAVSAQILGAYSFAKHRRVLDIGGGSGAFLEALGARYPQLELNLLDLPGVPPPRAPRITRHTGDFRAGNFPTGMDVITLIRVVHDHGDDTVLSLLKHVRSACDTRTVLVIAEPFAGMPGTASVTDAYFNFYFAAMGQGRTRTPQDIAALASKAGFGGLKEYRTAMPLITGVLTLLPNQAPV